MQIGEKFFAALLIILLILLSPIIVPLIIYAFIRDWIKDRRFESFLRANDGAKYFCYTPRKSSYVYVKENVLPNLPPDTRVILLGYSEDQVESTEAEIPFLYHLVWRIKKTPGGYPYAAKVSNGELITISVNHPLYKAIPRKARAEAVNKKITLFLDGDED